LIQDTKPIKTPLPVLTRGKDDRGPSAQGDLIPPFPTIERIELPKGQFSVQMNDEITLVGHHFALDAGDPDKVTVTVQFITLRRPQPISVVVPADKRSDARITVTIPHQAGVFYPAGLYTVTASVMPKGKPLEERATNELPLMIAPRIMKINGTDLPAPPKPQQPPKPPISAKRVNVDAANGLGDATLTVTCNPDVLPEQRITLVVGDREIAAEAHATQTNSLKFLVKLISAGTYRLRLRVDGVDSLLIDRSDPEQPRFDESQQVNLK
jgi:hypothetical protein